MAGENGAGLPALKVPTIAELRKAYQEGLPQQLLSGIEVVMRPVRPDALLMAGKIPDILTPLVLGMMFPKEKAAEEVVYPDEIANPVTHFLTKEREKATEAIEFVRAVDVVCEAALVEPDIVPYLSISDRMWIFKLAFMPAEVLSRFRYQPAGDVGASDDSAGESQPPKHAVAGDRPAKRAKPVDRLPAG